MLTFLFAKTSWLGVSKLPDFKAQFPRWEPQNLASILPTTLSDHGKDLFKVSSWGPETNHVLWENLSRAFFIAQENVARMPLQSHTKKTLFFFSFIFLTF